jgi:ABC-type sugar transport system ATPase subunit
MALIPEDRKTEGLMLPMSVRDNLSFAALPTLSRWGIVDKEAERDAVERVVRLLAGAHRRHRPAGRVTFRRHQQKSSSANG